MPEDSKRKLSSAHPFFSQKLTLIWAQSLTSDLLHLTGDKTQLLVNEATFSYNLDGKQWQTAKAGVSLAGLPAWDQGLRALLFHSNAGKLTLVPAGEGTGLAKLASGRGMASD